VNTNQRPHVKENLNIELLQFLHIYSNCETWNDNLCSLQLLTAWGDSQAKPTVRSVYGVPTIRPHTLCIWIFMRSSRGLQSMHGKFIGHDSVKILMFLSPTGFKLTTFSFSSLVEVCTIESSIMIGRFPRVLILNRSFFKLNWFIYNSKSALSIHFL
jgi:hypothetical protein